MHKIRHLPDYYYDISEKVFFILLKIFRCFRYLVSVVRTCNILYPITNICSKTSNGILVMPHSYWAKSVGIMDKNIAASS